MGLLLWLVSQYMTNIAILSETNTCKYKNSNTYFKTVLFPKIVRTDIPILCLGFWVNAPSQNPPEVLMLIEEEKGTQGTAPEGLNHFWSKLFVTSELLDSDMLFSLSARCWIAIIHLIMRCAQVFLFHSVKFTCAVVMGSVSCRS